MSGPEERKKYLCASLYVPKKRSSIEMFCMYRGKLEGSTQSEEGIYLPLAVVFSLPEREKLSPTFVTWISALRKGKLRSLSTFHSP